MLNSFTTTKVGHLPKLARTLFLGTVLVVEVACSRSIAPAKPLTYQQAATPNQSTPASSTSPPKSSGGMFAWRNVPLQGMGYVTGIVIHPAAPHDVYIRTDVGGAYRFERAKSRWLPLMDMFASRSGIGVESLAIDPHQPGRIYIVIDWANSTKGNPRNPIYTFAAEVFQSSDRGGSWQPLGFGAKNVYVSPNGAYRMSTGERLVVDPNQAGLLFFASRRDGLWRYDQSWQRVAGGLPDPKTFPNFANKQGKPRGDLPGFTFLVFDPRSAKSSGPTQTLYLGIHAVGSAAGGVWKSQNGGRSWANIGGAANPLRGVVASDGTLYAAFGTNGDKAGGSLRKLKNGVWSDITPEKRRNFNGITVQPNQPTTVMSISGNRVYRSTDGGINWTTQKMAMKADQNPTAPKYYTEASVSAGASTILIDPANAKQAWWTNGYGVARTDDVAAQTPFWGWQMQNLEEMVAKVLRVPPKLGGADLLANVGDMMGFRIESRNRVPNSTYNPVGIPVNPAFKWAMPQTWKTYPSPFPHVAMGTGLDYAYKKPDYAAFVGWHQWQYWPVYGYTSDNGRSWRAFNSVPKLHWDKKKQQYVEKTPLGGQIAMSPIDPKNMVWTPTRSVDPHFTKDAGLTWQPCKLANGRPLPNAWANSISPWVTPFLLAADRADPKGQTFYYFNGNTFYISKDGGATWNLGASGGFPPWIVSPAVVVNPTQPGEIWISFARNRNAVKANKLFRSVDGGKSFQPLETVKSAEIITFGRGLSATQPFVYIFGQIGKASQNAIYKSEDMGKTWKQISNPQVQQFPGITYMEGDMRTPNLVYVSLGGRGIMVGELR
ncbi:MAG: glycoside hydrolase [Aphanocapsa sp. GSE-SYN-MK-11-07L]|jgi:photosystem II stability/assembly factor-like uncharacterized protein|nr:glycoside hydrolase [Aphanocapsa sp. GSE-SYN-MK-11-07L]